MPPSLLPEYSNITNIFTTWLPVVAKLRNFEKDPATGSGILPVLNYLKDNQPQVLESKESIVMLGAMMPNILGGYPEGNIQEFAPDGLFLAVNFLLFWASLIVFSKDYRRGHFFYPLLFVCLYSLLCFIGFLCRYRWSYDLSNISLGLASLLLVQYPPYFLTFCNLIFAQRICNWKRPNVVVYNLMFAFFFLVGFASIILTVVAQMIPFFYILTAGQLYALRSLLMAGCLLEMVFTIVPFPFVYITASLSDLYHKSTLPVYQADWIQSTQLFYYPIPTHRTINIERYPKVIRIIPTLEAPGAGISRCLSRPLLPGAPNILHSHLIVLISSVALTAVPLLRFFSSLNTYYGGQSQYITSMNPLEFNHLWFPQNPIALWVFFGCIPSLVIAFWLGMRIDLRFYLAPIYWRKSEVSGTREKLQSLYETLT